MGRIMRNYSSKKGSALLLTLLIMTAVGGLLLTVSKVVIDSIHMNSTTSDADAATRMAMSGIEDGLARLNNFGAVNEGVNSSTYDYGDKSDTTHYLQPMRRGYTDGGCTTLGKDVVTSDTASYNSECPYYDMKISRMMSIKPGVEVANSTTLPINTPKVFNITGDYSYFTLQAAGGTTISVISCSDINGTGSCGAPTIGSTVTVSGSSVKSIKLSVLIYGINNKNVIVGSISTINGAYIDRGYTTVEVIGYAGGVRKGYMVTINADGTKKFQEIVDFSS